jgi:hypothetical protein
MSIDGSFDEFASEGHGGSAAGRGVRVDQILARAVPIHWDEAVALIQEIVDVLVSTRHAELPVPAFKDIVIKPDGAVGLLGSGRGEPGPLAAGRALHELLANTDVPVALRLFVSQANSQDAHESLRAFGDALAYFGKPGRAELIQAIYQRYVGNQAAAATPPAPRQSVPAFAPTTEARKEPAARRRRRPRWLVPAAVATCVVSLAAVMWLTVFGGPGGQATALLASAKAATATVAPVIASTLSTFSTPRTRTAEATSQSSQPTASRSVRPGQNTPLARTALDVSRAHRPSSAGVPVEPLRTPSRSDAEPSERSASAVAPIGVVPHEHSEPLETAAIYSHEDANVEPPVMLRPQLPPALMVGASPGGAVNRMELVVSADGTVERVRLVNGPRRMADMMLLSGAKLWRFAPAVKDGEPVRYRTTVSWAGFP